MLYLSRFIIENKREYYSGLLQVTKAETWEPWILYVLDAIGQTAKVTRDRILAIRDQMTATAEWVKAKAPKLYSKDLIEILYSQPYCKISFVERAGLSTRQTASNNLKKLVDLGLLTSVKKGKELYFINQGFLELLIT